MFTTYSSISAMASTTHMLEMEETVKKEWPTKLQSVVQALLLAPGLLGEKSV